MNENASRLTNLIEEILDLSLIKSGQRPLDRAPGDLGALLRQRHADWQLTDRMRTIRLDSGELPPVYMDAVAAGEVLDHLLRNALRHAPADDEILLQARVAPGGDLVEVSVHDRGPGLTPQQMKRLFQPFTHLQTPDAPGSQGSGLGLAFCRQVIERHHGTIRAESAEGQGATFSFTLPVVSPRFMVEEAWRCALEDARDEQEQFGLVLVSTRKASPMPVGLAHPPTEAGVYGEPEVAAEVMREAEVILRRSTHQGDRFVWFDRQTLGVFAVATRMGLDAMTQRLADVLRRAGLDLAVGSALFPEDGEQLDRIIDAAVRRSREAALATSGPGRFLRSLGAGPRGRSASTVGAGARKASDAKLQIPRTDATPPRDAAPPERAVNGGGSKA
jgi:hypothetical protein